MFERARRARRACRRDDRGSAVGTVGVIPATLLLIILVVQVSLWFYGRMTISAAAQHGLEQARVEQGSLDDGTAIVDQFLGQVGGIRGGYQRSATENDGEVTVRVEAEPIQIFHGLPLPSMSVEVSAPRERVIE